MLMAKKNDKKLCWNCDANVGIHFEDCPYCGVNLAKGEEEKIPSLKRKTPFGPTEKSDNIPKPPYASKFSGDTSASDEEWRKGPDQQTDEMQEVVSNKNELFALLLLLPGIVFFLFGLILMLFSHDGTLTLRWSDHFAYLYFIGAIPLIFIGWRFLKK